VSALTPLIQTVTTLPLLSVVRGMLSLSMLAGVVMFFKPLLLGIVRALVLLVKPRRTKAQKAASRQLRNHKEMQRMINAAHGASHTAELRALAARA
jgi:hypothetical protein